MRQSLTILFRFLVLSAVIGGCVSSPRFTTAVSGTPSSPPADYSEEGMASYYAEEFNGRLTSSGEKYDMNAMTAAHQTLPLGSMVRVTNLSTGKSVIVRINDRGPFKSDRIIDLSLEAAKRLECIGSGTIRVRIELVRQ